jgi:glycosyltransferase involved in cell wall biosynthesis
VGEGKAYYLPWEALDHIQQVPHAAIALREPAVLAAIKDRWSTRNILWLHDLNLNDLVKCVPLLKMTTIVGVSDFHATQIKTTLLSRLPGAIEGCRIRHIYNPVDLEPDATPVDPYLLAFTASPHKGLDHALYLFGCLRRLEPRYRLVVANPGYLPDSDTVVDGVERVGSLPHADVVRLVRSAFAVFHPNAVFPETFGLVHAEANAVGTPCLTSSTGANAEVLRPAFEQMLDVRNEKAVVDRLLLWQRQGRPAVHGRPEFKIDNVIDQWLEVLK